MLTCKEFLDELSDYFDETTDAEVHQKLEQHLNLCRNCWVICDTTKKTIRFYKGRDPVPIPPEIHARLIEALERKIDREGHEPRGTCIPSEGAGGC